VERPAFYKSICVVVPLYFHFIIVIIVCVVVPLYFHFMKKKFKKPLVKTCDCEREDVHDGGDGYIQVGPFYLFYIYLVLQFTSCIEASIILLGHGSYLHIYYFFVDKYIFIN